MLSSEEKVFTKLTSLAVDEVYYCSKLTSLAVDEVYYC